MRAKRGDRGSSTRIHEGRRASPEEARRPLSTSGPDRAGPHGRHPGAGRVLFIWFPAVSSIVLSFSNWDGIGGIKSIHFIGTRNYRQIATIYPPFWPAFRHNLYWLVFLSVIATPFGLLLAYLLDKEIRGTRIYQSIFFLPVVLSLAIIGFIWS